VLGVLASSDPGLSPLLGLLLLHVNTRLQEHMHAKQDDRDAGGTQT
jgi:hypothetical protein